MATPILMPFASEPTSLVEQPSTGFLAQGFTTQQPAANHINWIFKNLYDWVGHLNSNLGGVSLNHEHDANRNLLNIPFTLPSSDKKDDLDVFVKEEGSVGGISSDSYEADVPLTVSSGDKLSLDLVQTQSFSNGGRNGSYTIQQQTFAQSLISRPTSSYFNGKTNVREGFDSSVSLDLMTIADYSNELGVSTTELNVSNLAIAQTGNNLLGLRVIDQSGNRQNGALALKDIVASRSLNLVLANSLQDARDGNALVYELNNSNIDFDITSEDNVVADIRFNNQNDSRDGVYELNIANGTLGEKRFDSNRLKGISRATDPNGNTYYITNTLQLYRQNLTTNIDTLLGTIQHSLGSDVRDIKIIFVGSTLYLLVQDFTSTTVHPIIILTVNLNNFSTVEQYRSPDNVDYGNYSITTDGTNIFIIYRTDGANTVSVDTFNTTTRALTTRVSSIDDLYRGFSNGGGAFYKDNKIYTQLLDDNISSNDAGWYSIAPTGVLNSSTIQRISRSATSSSARDVYFINSIYTLRSRVIPAGDNLVDSIAPVYNKLSNPQNIGYIGLIESYTENVLGSRGGASVLSGSGGFNLGSYVYNPDDDTLKIVLTGTVAANSFAVLRIQQGGSDVVSLNSSDATYNATEKSFTWASISSDPVASAGTYKFIFNTAGSGIATFEFRKLAKENFEIDTYNNKNYLRILAGANVSNGDSLLVTKGSQDA